MTARKPPKEHKPPGRPPTYQPEFAEQTRKLCLLGATDADLARFFEVSTTSIDNWKLQHEEFRAALRSGKEVADAMVATRLYRRALGYKHAAVKIFCSEGDVIEAPYTEHYPPDTTAAIFWLKNRRSDLWRDRRDVDLAVNGPIEVVFRHEGK